MFEGSILPTHAMSDGVVLTVILYRVRGRGGAFLGKYVGKRGPHGKQGRIDK